MLGVSVGLPKCTEIKGRSEKANGKDVADRRWQAKAPADHAVDDAFAGNDT